MTKAVAIHFYNKGLQEAINNQLSEAVEHLTKATAYEKRCAVLWNLLGLCHYRLGNFGKAEYSWMQSLELQSEANLAQWYLVDLRMSLSEAVPFFATVSALGKQKKYRKAAAIFEKEIVTRFVGSVEILNYYGVLKAIEGDKRKAIAVWKQVLKIDTSNVKAYRYLSELAGQIHFNNYWFEGFMFWKGRS